MWNSTVWWLQYHVQSWISDWENWGVSWKRWTQTCRNSKMASWVGELHSAHVKFTQSCSLRNKKLRKSQLKWSILIFRSPRNEQNWKPDSTPQTPRPRHKEPWRHSYRWKLKVSAHNYHPAQSDREGETSVIAEEWEAGKKKGLKINFPPSDFESRLEASESLEGELTARLGDMEDEVDALKTADTGNISRPKSGKIWDRYQYTS